MSGSLYFPPKAQELDSNGEVYSGGLLYFYVSGTSTLKNTYQEKALTTPHTNPVVADSSGRWDPIFLDGTYKVVLKDSAGTTIWTEDPIEGITNLFNTVDLLTTTTSIDTTYKNKVVRGTGTWTANLLAVATATEGFIVGFVNEGSGTITIDANGSETINLATTLTLLPGESAILVADSAAWTAFVSKLNITDLTEDTTPDITADFVRSYDTSATGYKKVKLQTLLTRYNAGMMALSGATVSWDTGVLTPGNYNTSGTTYTGTLPLGASTEHTGMLMVLGGNGSTNDIQQIWFNGLIAGVWHRMTTDGGTNWTKWRETSQQNPFFGGRLTLTTAVPVLTADVTAATTIYYTPYKGDKISLYNGAEWYNPPFTELSNITSNSATGSAGPAAVTTNSNYDLFVWNNSGTLTLTRGPLWTSDTGRGTGAGTTELVMVNGIYLNANAITNGPAAQRGTYVGTFRTNGSSQVDVKFGVTPAAGGSAAVIGLWNMHNRVPVSAHTKDSTDSWTYTTASFQQMNASASNKVSFIRGINEETVSARLIAVGQGDTAGDAAGVAIGLDSATTASGLFVVGETNVANRKMIWTASYEELPGLGFHYLAPLEYGATTTTYYGDAGSATTLQTGMTVKTTW
jgi:hypothetical protein